MSKVITHEGLGISVESAWASADHSSLRAVCPSLAATIEKARSDFYFGFLLVKASEVDVFSICGTNRPEYEDDNTCWVAMFVVDIAFEKAGDRIAAVWLHPHVATLPNAADACSTCISKVTSEFAVVMYAAEFAKVARAIASESMERGK